MLKQNLKTIVNTHESKSGFLLLSENADAFITRIALCELAQHSLDIQYYAYHDDASGQLLRHKIIEAADRGVRVRILVDDISMGGRDTSFKLFSAHQNISIRIFNPLANREYFRNLELIINLRRAGRRMHNKTFIADKAIAIIGGRNIGDEYFDARHHTNYIDLDLLCIGPIVKDISLSFRDFWISHWAISIDKLSKTHIARRRIKSMRKRLKDRWNESKNLDYFKTLRHRHFANQLINDELSFIWSTAQLFYDKPEKLLVEQNNTTHIGPSVSSVISETKKCLHISSPYFVPGKTGVDMMRGFCKKGISVDVLTNSLASTDVTAAHAGYRRYRKPLLHAGVNLFEYKPNARGKLFFSNIKKRVSRTSLHAKYIISDREYLFIGSANIDPRSENLNTEIGIVIKSKVLAKQAIEIFNTATSTGNSYQLMLKENKQLIWKSQLSGVIKHYRTEPRASWWKRVIVTLITLLPVESLL